MASGVTNRLRYNLLGWAFRAVSIPANYTALLITNAAAPTADTNTFSELTEIAAGNGYTSGGVALAKNATDFDVFTEDDVNDRAYIQTKDIVFSAAGGPIPSSGAGAYHLVIADANATLGSREVYAFFDLTGPVSVSDGQNLTIQNPEIRAA